MNLTQNTLQLHRCALHILTTELKLNTSSRIGKLLFQFKLPVEQAIQYFINTMKLTQIL